MSISRAKGLISNDNVAASQFVIYTNILASHQYRLSVPPAIPTLQRASHSRVKLTEVTYKAGLRGGAGGQVTCNGRWVVNEIIGNTVLVNSGFQHPNKLFRKSLAIRAHATQIFARPVLGRKLKIKKKKLFEGHQIISQSGAPTRIGLALVTKDTGKIRYT